MKQNIMISTILVIVFCMIIIAYQSDRTTKEEIVNKQEANEWVSEGKEKYRGFVLDNVFHSKDGENIHYNVYIPNTYDGSAAYALYFTLSGYQGLYFQGVGENVKTEEFGYVAREYQPKMIIVAPQLNDWDETSANQTIALLEYFISHYNIDQSKIYANGYSAGGETMSIVMGKRPELLSRYLHASSKWNGDLKILVESETPIYIVIGENDEYYGSESSRETYDKLYQLYENKGLSHERIDEILILDIKDTSYFKERNVTNQHGGGAYLFVKDKQIMGWLLN